MRFHPTEPSKTFKKAKTYASTINPASTSPKAHGTLPLDPFEELCPCIPLGPLRKLLDPTILHTLLILLSYHGPPLCQNIPTIAKLHYDRPLDCKYHHTWGRGPWTLRLHTPWYRGEPLPAKVSIFVTVQFVCLALT